MAFLLLAAFAAVVFAGCAPKVEGVFSDSQGGVVYQGKVASEQRIMVGQGGWASLHISGCTSRGDVTVVAEKGCCDPGTTVVIAGGGLAVVSVAVWSMVDFLLDQDNGFDYVVGPVFGETIVYVGDDFVFTLLVDEGIEGEGEVPVEGEPEGEGEFIPLSVEILAPVNGRVFNAGDVATVRVLPNGDPSSTPLRLVVRNAELETRVAENVAPGVEKTLAFTLNLVGTGAFTAYLEDKDGAHVTTSVTYSVIVPIEGEPVVEGEDEGEPVEGEGEGCAVVPDLSGLTENQARAVISSTCLVVGTVLFVDDSNVPAGYVVSWNPTGTVSCGTAINLVISTGPVIEGEGEAPVEGESEGEGEAIEGEGEFIPLSVEILAPASGQVFNIGDTVTVRVLPNGDPSLRPLRLVVRNAELTTWTVEDVTPGVEATFTFTVGLFGPGAFTGYVEDRNGLSVTTYCPYSVAIPE